MCEGPETDAPLTVRNYVPRKVYNLESFKEADKDAPREERRRFFQFGAGKLKYVPGMIANLPIE